MSDTVKAVLIDGKPIGYFPPTSAENVTYEEGVSVKDALDGAKWTCLGQTTGNAEITIPDGVSEVYGRSILSSTSTSFHFLTIEGDIAVDRGGGYYVSSTNCAAASYRWTNATRKANLNGFNFAGTDYTSTATTKWYVKS